MPFINTNGYKAWQVLQNAVASGVFSNPDGLLLPKEMSWAEKIVLSEMGYQEAVNNGTDWNLLRQYKDFAELAGERRANPTRDQWFWLYKNIGIRHQNLSVDEVCGIMSGRDALLPFLRTAPDLRFHKLLDVFNESGKMSGTEPIAYPQMENALQNDSLAKLKVLKIICRGITNEMILARSVYLQKPHIVSSLLTNMPQENQVPMLIGAMRYWEHPAELLRLCVEHFGDKIAAWHDEYGNAFFWYLYISNHPVTPEIIDALSPEIIETFEPVNCYGIAPSDIWYWYRQGMKR